MKVAIIGMGVVGQAQARMLCTPEAAELVVTWDIASEQAYPADHIARCDFAMICVGTPPAADGRADLSQVHAALEWLPEGLPALVRSTVPPGTVDSFGDERLIGYWPEFMHERHGGIWSETDDVPFAILGGSAAAREFFAPFVGAMKPRGPLYQCDAVDAEMAKYVANLHWATKVTFVNEMAAIAEAVGADWERVREAWMLDSRVSMSYTRMKGFEPGFGGRCWPKDLAALIMAASDAGYEPEFLDSVLEANERFRK